MDMTKSGVAESYDLSLVTIKSPRLHFSLEPNALGLRLVPSKFAGSDMTVWQPMAHDKNEPRLWAQIDENLKRVYDEALEDEVPQRFKDLLALLRQKAVKK